MPQLKIMGFDGIIPRMSATMLADNQAQIADNVKLYSRELRYWRGPASVSATLRSSTKTIYKYYASAANPYWLSWSTPVDVVTSPMTDTSDYRIYYTGDGVPKKANETLVSTGTGAYPRGWYNMGVPAPTVAPTCTHNTGTGTTEDRVYIYTYVSTFGSVKEESAPSPPSTITSVHSAGATISGFGSPPTTNYNITDIRIYRSVTGATTDTYQFVAEIPIATTSYSDSLSAAQLGEVIGTIGWLPPPTNLAGIVALPSGALAGFVDNTVYFSEPYYPHAWPLKYALNVPFKIIGLAVFGTSIAVMTERYPHVINGAIPGAMSVERLPILEPCVSKRSIVSNEGGVLYASPNGMVGIGGGSAGLITNSLFRRDEWQVLQPNYINGATYDGKYVAFYEDGLTGTTTFVMDPSDIPALSTLSDTYADAVHVDTRNGYLYYVINDQLYQYDADELNPIYYEWKSKRFVLPQATSFSALKLDGDFTQADLATAYNQRVAEILASNQAIFSGGSDLDGVLNRTVLDFYDVNGSKLANIPLPASARTAQVMIYGDGQLQTTLTINSFDPVRIPPFKARTIEVQLVGNMSVRSIALATTVPELHQ